MNETRLPLLIEPDHLASILDQPGIVIVDLCKAETYAQTHIPGAVHLDYQHIVWSRPPVMGLLPDAEHLSALLSQTGISPDSYLVVYDDEGGGKAARFIYTLDVIGHDKYSLLNGGLHAWANEGHPLQSSINKLPVTEYPVILHDEPVATKQFILTHLELTALQIIDARSLAEYTGQKKFAEKAGHIPGAINIDWLLLIDKQRNLRLRSNSELHQLMADRDISRDKATIVYCQTHHRSALTYFALKYLGYTNLKGYPGSWSEWGNSTDTPVELGQQLETI